MGAAVVEWLSSWLVEQEVRVSILKFQRLVYSCFQVSISLKYRYLKRRKSSTNFSTVLQTHTKGGGHLSKFYWPTMEPTYPRNEPYKIGYIYIMYMCTGGDASKIDKVPRDIRSANSGKSREVRERAYTSPDGSGHSEE